MLCSLKTKRPDKYLEKRLLFLSYALVGLMTTVIMFMLYPQYSVYLLLLTLFISSFCLWSTIKTLQAGEEAISYGGFANELLKEEHQGERIDNSSGEAVLENDYARDFFKGETVLSTLRRRMSENRQNKTACELLERALENLSKEKVNIALYRNEGNTRGYVPEEWYEITLRPMYLKKTDIFSGAYSIKKIKKDTYFYWTIKDVTAQKNMEQIFQSESRGLHDFLDYLPAGLYICNKDYKIEYVNHALAKLLQSSREDLTGKNLKDYLATNSPLPPAHTASWQGNLYLLSGNEVKECYAAQENFRENSEIKTRGVIINGLISSKELSEQHKEDVDRISWLFDFAPISIIHCNKEGTIIELNDASSKFLGQDSAKLNGKNILEIIKDEEKESLREELSKLQSKEKSSSCIDVHLNITRDEKVATFYISPIRGLHEGPEAEPCGFSIYFLDATSRKNLELQYAQAQKMQALGQMAGGVAHDFNNLLTAMIGFCDLLMQRHGVGDPSFSDIIQIKNNANRAAGLVRQLLAFSRKQPLKPKLIDVTENFVELNHMLKRVIGEQVTLKFYHGSDLGYIRVDPVQFSQVIINLAVNAKDAMNNRGTLTISTHTETLLEPYQFGADTIAPGDFVVIEVKDTGCGIPIENLSRIFEPFFSTKQNVVGSGTGLGLAMVYGIVRQTEGFIKVQSIIGKGTTFSIYLPRFENNEEETKTTQNETKEIIKASNGSPILTVQEKIVPTQGSNAKLIFGLNVSAIDRNHENSLSENENIRILFVEDEDSVRTFAVRALKKKGYEVIGCNSAENALDFIKDDKDFQMMITDMVMPGMNGAELAQTVKEQIPNIKIILASGYSEEIARRELAGSDEFAFIAKPFSLGDLTKKVFDVLNSKD